MLFDIKFKGDKRLQKLLSTTKRKITKEINEGFHDILDKSLERLKRDLKDIITTEVRVPLLPQTKEEKANNILPSISDTIPKSTKDFIKYLYNKNIPQITGDLKRRGSLPYSKDRIFVANTGNFKSQANELKYGTYNHIRLMVEGENNIISAFQKAEKQYGEGAIFIFVVEGKVQVYLNQGLNLSKYIKVECSTKTGYQNEESQRVFNSYFGSGRKNDGTAILSLTKEGIKYIQENAINLTEVSENLEQGNIPDAINNIQTKIGKNNKLQNELIDKVTDLEQGKNLPQDIQAYSDLINLINSLEFKRKNTRDGVQYRLKYEDAISDYNQLLSTIKRHISSWAGQNMPVWNKQFKKKFNKVLSKYR